MKERTMDRQRPIVARCQATEIAQPGDVAFDDSAPLVALQRPSAEQSSVASDSFR